MASLTYCWWRSIGSSSIRHQRHQFEQICLLIITFVVYVSGITNNIPHTLQNTVEGIVSSGNDFQNGYYQQQRPTYESLMPTNYDFQRPITPPTPPTTTVETTIQKEFRPSEQIYEFTISDATPVTTNYPPSYLNTNYKPITTITSTNNFPTKPQQIANKRYNIEENSQFMFPTETVNNIYNNRISTVSPQLQTTPILSYKDPFTNKNYQATTLSQQFKGDNNDNDHDDDDANIIYYGNHQYQGDVTAQQAYTVQSSLLVGGQSNHNRDDNYRPLSSASSSSSSLATNNEYKRPGYVFDEPKIQPNYVNKFQQQMQPNAFQVTTATTPILLSSSSSSFGQRKPPFAPQRLSYDSHDYPPPSYYQKPNYQQQHPHQQQQQSTYFQSPQRQDIGLNPISQASTQTETYLNAAPTSSNYANNFGNYLLANVQQQQQPQHQHQQQHYTPTSIHQGNYYTNQQRPSITAHRPPSNYYEYQLGEIPPAQQRPPSHHRQPIPPYNHNYPNYNVQRPPMPPPPPQHQQQSSSSGLASLASLFTTTQQYAPQFTNLLLGAFTGGGNGGSTSSSHRPQQRPLNMQLIRALENIARNDDLQCVPKVLCQTIAGQTQRGQLPSFVTSPAITNFLAGFPAASPALIYGRAALLGISGGERSCAQTYENCPKNEYEILYYLNNHRGGFFKFFSEPEEQTSATNTNGNGNYDDSNVVGSGSDSGGGGGGGVSSLLSFFNALTGNQAPRPTTTTTTTTTQRPTTTLDVAGGIGNFFTQVLSDYLSGVEYQRRRRRSIKAEIEVDTIEPKSDVEITKILNDEDFHDEEDNKDTAEDELTAVENYQDIEARILHKDEIHADYPKFFPQDDEKDKHQTSTFNKEKAIRKLKFPSTQVNDRDPGKLGISWFNFENSADAHASSKRRGKKKNFKQQDITEFTVNNFNGATETNLGQRIIFPDHYEQYIRKGRILNKPNYAASYGDYVRATTNDQDRFIISNNHRRPHFQDYNNQANGLGGQYYAEVNSHYTSSSASSSSISSLSSNFGNRYNSGQETSFRPTPLPNGNKYGSSSNSGYKGYHGSNSHYSGSNSAYGHSQSQTAQYNYNYPNNNYVSNNRYSSNYQRFATTTTTRRPPHLDDPNVYINNGNGITEYYITPDGRKIYL